MKGELKDSITGGMWCSGYVESHEGRIESSLLSVWRRVRISEESHEGRIERLHLLLDFLKRLLNLMKGELKEDVDIDPPRGRAPGESHEGRIERRVLKLD